MDEPFAMTPTDGSGFVTAVTPNTSGIDDSIMVLRVTQQVNKVIMGNDGFG